MLMLMLLILMVSSHQTAFSTLFDLQPIYFSWYFCFLKRYDVPRPRKQSVKCRLNFPHVMFTIPLRGLLPLSLQSITRHDRNTIVRKANRFPTPQTFLASCPSTFIIFRRGDGSPSAVHSMLSKQLKNTTNIIDLQRYLPTFFLLFLFAMKHIQHRKKDFPTLQSYTVNSVPVFVPQHIYLRKK